MLLAVTPSTAAAGQTVTVTGKNFYSADGRISATVGSADAGIDCPSETTCRVTMPKLHRKGTVDLVVTTEAGPSSPLSIDYR